jgi:hypothetical protein
MPIPVWSSLPHSNTILPLKICIMEKRGLNIGQLLF